MKPGVCIIQSEKTGRYYIGSTENIILRLKQHNQGKNKSTKGFSPWKLRRFIECDSISLAKQHEFRLKKYKRRDIVEKVINDNIFPWDY